MIKLILWLLRGKSLTVTERIEVVNALLDKQNALPIKQAISHDENFQLIVNGRKLTPEEHDHFMQSIQALSNSFALKAIRDQVAFECVKIGVHQAMNNEQILFAKAALWYQQEETKLIASLLNR
jgi:hypothetical protein